ncbi:ParB/RepB/Spo0J family partition protein [Cribrihabitans pelagius]|uniref:ParB/RepB/Spo0J family partition protein n=1 Tax=Cribrihabitans pelagius TaxID=1765746 RepID=UPI003B5A6777
MAKRKRLTPAQTGFLAAAPDPASGPGPLPGAAPAPRSAGLGAGAAPIAQVASEASAQAALQELSSEMERARARGLMIAELPLSAIDESHLVRDRIEQDEGELAALMASLSARGQQTPAEVVPLEDPAGGMTHGLISGWRRLTALRRLFEETGEPRFATLKALVIRPESAQDAYLAMVEENEIRVNLSHYERARIAVRACKEGVFTSRKYALQGLFGNATRAKRSKIGSFIAVVEALDAVLFFPAAISEKLGLALARAIEADPTFAPRARAALQAAPRPDAETELALLSQLAEGAEQAQTPAIEPDNSATASPAPAPAPGPAPSPAPAPPLSRPRVRGTGDWDAAQPGERIALAAPKGLSAGYVPGEQRIEIRGEGVNAALVEALQDWLKRL